MLYRNKKPDDMNEGKWIGIGGKVEEGESPEECNSREVLEETGLKLLSAHFHGVIGFRSDMFEDEDMYLYSSDCFVPCEADAAGEYARTGNYVPPVCSEGELRWIPKDKVMELPAWEGDRFFLKHLIEGRKHICMTLVYEGENCKVIDEDIDG